VSRRLARRTTLLVFAILVALVCAACSSGPSVARISGAGWVDGPPHPAPAGAATATPPNIVFVLTDDLNWNLLRFMPHVQALERQGVTFPNYFVTDSLCCPSRTSIFTGEFPHNDGVWANLGPHGGFRAFLANHDQRHTYAPLLQSRGYETGMFGKFVNLYQPVGTYFGQRPYVPPGWSAWNVPNGGGYDEFDYTLAVGRKLGLYGSQPRDYLTSVLAQKTGEFMTASVRAHRPFMAEIATYTPHSPFVPAPRDASRFPGLKAPRDPEYGERMLHAPAWLRAIPHLTPADREHLDLAFRRRAQDVVSVDRMIAGIEQRLRSLGVADNTYLVFSSDNGLHLGEYNLLQGKATAYDTDVRVPLIVTGPGVPAGRRVDQLASNVDLAPTFESIAGDSPPSTVDGRSLLPLLHGQVPADWRDGVLIEHLGSAVQPTDPDYQPAAAGDPPSYEAIRTLRYLYVEYADGEREFHDLRSDPYELDNTYDATTAALRAALHAAVTRLARCRGTPACWAAQRSAPSYPLRAKS
jgi:arylsulfatase A-like enzyme